MLDRLLLLVLLLLVTLLAAPHPPVEPVADRAPAGLTARLTANLQQSPIVPSPLHQRPEIPVVVLVIVPSNARMLP